MRIVNVAALMLAVLGAQAGCASSTDTPAPSGDAGAGVADGGADGGAGLGFVPSNVDSVDLSGTLGDIVLNDCGAQIRAGETGRLACIDPADRDTPFRYTEITQADGTKLKVFVVKSLRIPSGVAARVVASVDPIAIVALDTIEIEGSLLVEPGLAGGFAAPNADAVGNGPGGGKNASGGGQGDGGGGYCGKGGSGGGAGAGGGGATYGNAQLSPLLPGSSGAGQFAAPGGGALQLVAKNMIRVGPGGSINVGGGGSDQGGAGAGGALLLEAPSVQIAGKIAANGGGGGAGTGSLDGKDGQLDDLPTSAGAGDARGGGGGAGGAGASVDGQAGVGNSDYPDGNFAGNGGGGAGRIRINTTSGAAAVTGLVSPSLAGTCGTQGTLRTSR